MLIATPVPTADDLRVLGEIDAMRQDLATLLRNHAAPWSRALRRHLTADAIAASNTIEGIRVATSDVEALVEGDPDVDVSEDERAETLAYQQMMTYIQSLHDVEPFAYNRELLNALHWMLQGHRHSRQQPAGQFRRGPVYVTDARDPRLIVYEAADVRDVSGLIDELVEWLNDGDTDVHPLVRAAMAHLNLVSIHPWRDGNGRMSRSLQTLLIAREGVLAPEFSSIEAWLGSPDHTWRYYEVLHEVQGPAYRPAQSDAASWLPFNLVAYHQQAQAVAGRFALSADVWGAAAEFVSSRGLPERVVAALHDTALDGTLRVTRYMNAEGLSRQQAQRDLRQLVEADVLEAEGATRARRYRPGTAFPPAAREAGARKVRINDPYRH